MAVNYEAAFRTRSTDTDYAWIGTQPVEWWLKGWGPSLLRREPTLLRQGREAGGGILITGIQSDRRDAIHTRIRYEVSLTPSPSGLLSETAVSALIHSWWEQRRIAQTDPWPLGTQFDAQLLEVANATSKNVDELLAAADTNVVATVIRSIERLAVAPANGGAWADRPAGPLWVGADGDAARQLLAGDAAVAYFGGVSPKTVDQLRSLPPDVIALVDGDQQVHPRPKLPAPSNPGPRRESHQDQERGGTRKWLLLLLVAISGAIVLYLILKVVLGGKSN